MKPFLVLSTSSPRVAVGVIGEDNSGQLQMLSKEGAFVERNAEEATFLLLHEALDKAGARLEDLVGIVADVGPGSFTGVRVGVTIAKTLAWAKGLPVAGVRSFALISEPPVAVPSRKGRYLALHTTGEVEEVEDETVRTVAAAGYGSAFPDPLYPDPERVLLHWSDLRWAQPEELVPEYVLEPGISKPKVPYPNVEP